MKKEQEVKENVIDILIKYREWNKKQDTTHKPTELDERFLMDQLLIKDFDEVLKILEDKHSFQSYEKERIQFIRGIFSWLFSEHGTPLRKEKIDTLHLLAFRDLEDKERTSIIFRLLKITDSPFHDETFLTQLYSCFKIDYPVLIIGETGTGKELYAKAIHYLSKRSGKPFIPVNCGGIPSHLIECELFGYKKGAFTDAYKDKDGYLKVVEDGTIFLDEIGDMPIEMQVKLLRVLNDNKFVPIGGNPRETEELKARIICATNKNLNNLIKEGKFREDLFHRINTLDLRLPPLRNILIATSDKNKRQLFNKIIRDISIEILHKQHHIISKNQQKDHDKQAYLKLKSKMHFTSRHFNFTDQAFEFLSNYHYPGNYREFENIIRKALLKIDLYSGKPQTININGNAFFSQDDYLTDPINNIDIQSMGLKEIEEYHNKLLRKKYEHLLLKHKGKLKECAIEIGFGESSNSITKFRNLANDLGLNYKNYRKLNLPS